MYELRRKAALAGLLAAGMLTLTGCPPGAGSRIGALPRNAREAVSRVNDNLSRIKDAIVCRHAEVSFRFKDEGGRERRFWNQPAALIFQSPRNLYFDITSLGGTVARVGSNAERYWLWIEADVSTMWWGEWARGGGVKSEKLPLPPDQVLAALCLAPLATPGADLKSAGNRDVEAQAPLPLLIVNGSDVRLIYGRTGASGWPYAEREIVLDPAPPYQPTRIIHRRSDGEVTMQAVLSKYRPIGKDGPYTPRRYEVRWPLDDAELHMDLGDVIFRPDQPAFHDFPTEPPVRHIERIDGGPEGQASVLNRIGAS